MIEVPHDKPFDDTYQQWLKDLDIGDRVATLSQIVRILNHHWFEQGHSNVGEFTHREGNIVFVYYDDRTSLTHINGKSNSNFIMSVEGNRLSIRLTNTVDKTIPVPTDTVIAEGKLEQACKTYLEKLKPFILAELGGI